MFAAVVPVLIDGGNAKEVFKSIEVGRKGWTLKKVIFLRACS